MNRRLEPQATSPSFELREDPILGDWVLIASERAKRAQEKWLEKPARVIAPEQGCVFEDPREASGGAAPVLEFGKGKQWRVAVIDNKYPALTHGEVCPVTFTTGPYRAMGGIGRHEVLITRDHRKNFSDLGKGEAEEVFRAFTQRYKELSHDPCVQYISVFQNWGRDAGASQDHPHFQIIALPVVPPHVMRSLRGSRHYFEKHQTCAHCAIIKWERNSQVRVVFENRDAIVTTPYASGQSFEMRVFPKVHNPDFAKEGPAGRAGIAEALRQALKLLKLRLRDPDYNLFIHTSPVKDGAEFGHYHWHIEILPKTNIPAGFELGTHIAINAIPPERAAQFLKTGK